MFFTEPLTSELDAFCAANADLLSRFARDRANPRYARPITIATPCGVAIVIVMCVRFRCKTVCG